MAKKTPAPRRNPPAPRRPKPGATTGAGEFKTHGLRLTDQVSEEHTEIVITKHGRPVARLVPNPASCTATRPTAC